MLYIYQLCNFYNASKLQGHESRVICIDESLLWSLQKSRTRVNWPKTGLKIFSGAIPIEDWDAKYFWSEDPKYLDHCTIPRTNQDHNDAFPWDVMVCSDIVAPNLNSKHPTKFRSWATRFLLVSPIIRLRGLLQSLLIFCHECSTNMKAKYRDQELL